MDITNFIKPKQPASASPKPVVRSLRGLTLQPVAGWEGCATPITVKRGTRRTVGRAELQAHGTVGISKLHCTLEAQAARMVLTATASFNVIVVHTFTGEDKSVETFRRLQRGATVHLEPGDRIYMAVDPAFAVSQAPPPKEQCAYAFKVVAATADEVASAIAATPSSTAAAAAAASRTTPTPSPVSAAAAASMSASTSASVSSQGVTPLGKRAAGADLEAGSSSKSPRHGEGQGAAAAGSAATGNSPPGTIAHSSSAATAATGSAGASAAGTPAQTGDSAQTNKKKSRMLRELESDRGYVGSAQCSPEEASRMNRRQRRRTSASSASSSEGSPPAAPTPTKPAAVAGPKRAQKPAAGKPNGGATAKAKTVAPRAPAAASAPSSTVLKVTGESRKAERADIGRRVEVHWTAGESGWYGGTIRGFVGDKFRVEYDDGSKELETLGEAKTFLPDPAEEQRCQKPPKPSELLLVYDPELKMPLVCRLVGGRPDGGRRVRFIGWSRQNDRTCWGKDKAEKGWMHVLDMTSAADKQKATKLNNQINKIDKAHGDAGRARVGSKVTVDGLSGDHSVWDVAIRQETPKSDFQLMYLLADKKTWLPESKLLTVEGRPLKSNGLSKSKTAKEAADVAASAAAAADPEEAAAATVVKLRVDQGGEQPVKDKPEIPFVAAFQEDWEDLMESEQKAARELGWNQERWDTGDEPPCREQRWSELNQAQRMAATVLGWDESCWATVPPMQPLGDAAAGDGSSTVLGAVTLLPPPRKQNTAAGRRRSSGAGAADGWEELAGNEAQHVKLELDEAVGDDGDVASLPGFLHFIAHNAELGHVPPKGVYDELLSQLLNAAAAGQNADAMSAAAAASAAGGGDESSQTFSQEMEEDEEAMEAESRSRRTTTRTQGAIHATLHGLLSTMTAADCDGADDSRESSVVPCAAAGWTPLSLQNGGSGGPKQEDFQRFERSLAAVHNAVRAACCPAQPAAAATAAAAVATDACSGAALFLDYTTAVLADGRGRGPIVAETSILWQLLYASNQSGSEGQIKEVMQHCVGIIGAASVALSASDGLAPCNGASSSHSIIGGRVWLAVNAAQRLLGLAIAVGASAFASSSGSAGSQPPLVIAPAQGSSLYQLYLERLQTHQSKQLFLSTLPSSALQMYMLDRVLCPGKQQQQQQQQKQAGAGAGAIWQRIFAWTHCPPQLRMPPASTSTSSRRQASANVSASSASSSGSTASPSMRQRIERLLLLYSAALEQPQQSAVGTELQAPEGFFESLEKQQAHLCRLLLQ